MSLLKKIFNNAPDDESILESESAFSKELHLDKPENWYLVIFGEFLRCRKVSALSSANFTESPRLFAELSDPGVKLKAICNHFGIVTLGRVERWIKRLNKVFRKGSSIDLHKYQKVANEYQSILREVAYFEKTVSDMRSTDRKVNKAKNLLDGAFYASIQPLMTMPEKLLRIREEGIQGGVLDLTQEFHPVPNVSKAKKILRNI